MSAIDKNKLSAKFEKTKKTVVEYSESLKKENVADSTILKNVEYMMDRFFADTLKKQAEMPLDAPSECPISTTFRQYGSILKEYTGAIERKWIIAGNELKKVANNEAASCIFEPIKDDYENKIRSMCGVCRIRHESGEKSEK